MLSGASAMYARTAQRRNVRSDKCTSTSTGQLLTTHTDTVHSRCEYEMGTTQYRLDGGRNSDVSVASPLTTSAADPTNLHLSACSMAKSSCPAGKEEAKKKTERKKGRRKKKRKEERQKKKKKK